jgi:membrane protease subunit (stomatin/prohibitin family)
MIRPESNQRQVEAAMSLMGFIKKQFIDVIEWQEPGDGILAWRYPMQDNEIQNGARLTVRESQAALFVNEGRAADAFGPGLYTLNTHTLPLLTNLMNWDKLFASPFKSDVYFFSTRLQVDQRWGTPQPVTRATRTSARSASARSATIRGASPTPSCSSSRSRARAAPTRSRRSTASCAG